MAKSKKKPKAPKIPECPYCGKASKLASSKEVYGGRDYGPIYLCKCVPGWAYVGCHKGTEHAKGRLADAELRRAKIAAHGAFDPIWKNKAHGVSRSQAYKALAAALEIEPKHCHIGMFDVEQCQRVVEVCGYIMTDIAGGALEPTEQLPLSL